MTEAFLEKGMDKKRWCSMQKIRKIVALLLPHLLLLLFLQMLAHQTRLTKVIPMKGGDYCFLVPSYWAHFLQPKDNQPHWLQLDQSFTFSALCCLPSSFGEDYSEGAGLSTSTASGRKADCNFFESSRLQGINGTQGLLTLGGDALVTFPGGSKHAHDWDHCEELTIPVDLLSSTDFIYLFFKKLGRDLGCNMGIMFILAVGTVSAGGYWAGATEKKRQQYIKSNCKKRDYFEYVTINPNIPFICGSIATSSVLLLMLYCFYDHVVCLMIGLFCLYASLGLYSCLSPSLNKLPFGEQKVYLQHFHKGLEVKKLLLAGFSIFIVVLWMVFRNEDQWAWILQDALGISICLYELKTVHIPKMKNCSLFLLALLVYDVFFVFITPLLTKCGDSIMEMVALGPFNTAHHEKIPFLLKIPAWYPSSAFDNGPFTVLGLGDILIPGFLVAYSYRFDIRAHTSWIYFVTSTIAYTYGLLVSFTASTLTQKGQPALLYLVTFTLTACLLVAFLRQELTVFWTGNDFTKQPSCPPLEISISHHDIQKGTKTQIRLKEGEEQMINRICNKEQPDNSFVFKEEFTDTNIHSEEKSFILSREEISNYESVILNKAVSKQRTSQTP
ncbi:signal peptide peptidase-like 2B [Rhea pennata]|uniref:signal peptide peptidase-like 2B n=1 Tax=Rhea pennata TaxID=8795 RepID=UPI002E268852